MPLPSQNFYTLSTSLTKPVAVDTREDENPVANKEASFEKNEPVIFPDKKMMFPYPSLIKTWADKMGMPEHIIAAAFRQAQTAWESEVMKNPQLMKKPNAIAASSEGVYEIFLKMMQNPTGVMAGQTQIKEPESPNSDMADEIDQSLEGENTTSSDQDVPNQSKPIAPLSTPAQTEIGTTAPEATAPVEVEEGRPSPEETTANMKAQTNDMKIPKAPQEEEPEEV